MSNPISLKRLQNIIKKSKKVLELQKAITKEGVVNPNIERLENNIKNVRGIIGNRTDPTKAVRCSLPKKQQRKLGLLPAI